MRTIALRFLCGMITILIFSQAFAVHKSYKSNLIIKITDSVLNQLLESEAELQTLYDQRTKEAESILDNRIKIILDKFLLDNKTKIQAIQSEWNTARGAFNNDLNQYISIQSELFRASLNQLKYQSLASATGATIASVNYVQFNYGRESIRRTGPQHLLGMASLLRSGSSVIEGYLAGFTHTENLIRELSKTLELIEANVAIDSDSESLLSQLSTLQLQIDYLNFDANLEANKARAFIQLLENLKNYANQNSSNPSLQALIRATEDRKYPVGSLSNIRSLVSSFGTSWLTYAPDIYESVLLTTAFLSELNGKFAQTLSAELQRIESKQSFDELQYFRVLTNTSLRLIPILVQSFRNLTGDCERISSLLTETSALIQNSPNTASSRFQRLMSNLISTKNSFRSTADELLLDVADLTDDLSLKQTSLESSLDILGGIRARFKATGTNIPIDFDFINEFKYFLHDKEALTYVFIPNYWQQVSQVKVQSKIQNKKTTQKLNRCIEILSEEELLDENSIRIDEVKKCIQTTLQVLGKKNRKNIKSAKSFFESKIGKINKKEFIERLEKDFYGDSLITYANSMNLDPPAGEDEPFQDDE